MDAKEHEFREDASAQNSGDFAAAFPFLPRAINTGPWVGAYALDELRSKIAAGAQVVLPICSLGTPWGALAGLGGLVLPPLYHEAFAADDGLKVAVVDRVRRCLPFCEGTRARAWALFRFNFEVVELPPRPPARPDMRPRVLAIGVDTTIEQHGPHLPLATDTIQTYAVLRQLVAEEAAVTVGPPLDYGHLTWGLAFGMSVDLTAALLERYALGFVNALVAWLEPEALYVADVHGSAVHRETVQRALRASACRRWAFRWLHDPLGEFAGARGDMHAGGVETALIAHIGRELVDAEWWPARVEELAAGEMTVDAAAALSGDVGAFAAEAERRGWNGIVGQVRSAATLDGKMLFQRMVEVARADVAQLRG